MPGKSPRTCTIGRDTSTTSPAFNLVLIYNPGSLDPEDFREIANHMASIAPDIEVLIVANALLRTTPEVLRKAAGRATLLISPQPLQGIRLLRGKIYSGGAIPKLDQMRRMKAAGLPVPPGR